MNARARIGYGVLLQCQESTYGRDTNTSRHKAPYVANGRLCEKRRFHSMMLVRI